MLKWVNFILNKIAVNSLRFGGLQISRVWSLFAVMLGISYSNFNLSKTYLVQRCKWKHTLYLYFTKNNY